MYMCVCVLVPVHMCVHVGCLPQLLFILSLKLKFILNIFYVSGCFARIYLSACVPSDRGVQKTERWPSAGAANAFTEEPALMDFQWTWCLPIWLRLAG